MKLVLSSKSCSSNQKYEFRKVKLKSSAEQRFWWLGHNLKIIHRMETSSSRFEVEHQRKTLMTGKPPLVISKRWMPKLGKKPT